MNPVELAAKQAISPTYAPTPDNNWIGRGRGNMGLGSQESVTKTGIHWLADMYAGQLGKKYGLAYITEEEFEQAGFGRFTTYKAGEYFEQARLRADYEAAKEKYLETSAGSGVIESLAWGMLGNTVQPGDLLLGYAPFAAASKGMSYATKAMVQGTRATKAARMAAQSAKMLQQSRKIPTTVPGVLMQNVKLAFPEQVAEAAAVLAMSKATDRDYTFLDAGADVLIGPLFVAGLGSFSARNRARQGKMMAEIITHQSVIKEHLSVKGGSGIPRAVEQMIRFSNEFSTGEVNAALQADPEARAAWDFLNNKGYLNPDNSEQSDISFNEQTRQQIAVLENWLIQNHAAAWRAKLEGIIQMDEHKPTLEAEYERRERIRRLTEWAQTGDTSKTEPGDFEVLADYPEMVNPNWAQKKQGSMDARILNKDGFYGERPSDFVDAEGKSVSTQGNKLWRGVYFEPKVNENGDLIIPSIRDQMFADNIGEKEGKGSSFTTSPNEAAHYAMQGSVQEVRIQAEEVFDESEFFDSPTIIEIDAETVSHLKSSQGTESGELRFQHEDDLTIPKGKFRILKFKEFEGKQVMDLISSGSSNERLFSRKPNPQKLAEDMETDGRQASHEQLKQEAQEAETVKTAASETVSGKARDNWPDPLQKMYEELEKFRALPADLKKTTDLMGNIQTAAGFDTAFMTDPEFLAFKKEVELVSRRVGDLRLKRGARTEVFIAHIEKKMPWLIEDWHQALVSTKTEAEARDLFYERFEDDMNAHIAQRYHDTMVRVQHDGIKSTKTKNPEAHALNYLKSWLDGRARKGVKLGGASVQSKQQLQIHDDQALLRHILNKYKIDDVFFGVGGSFVSKLTGGKTTNVKSPQAVAVYGESLREASDMFWQDMFDYNIDGELPDRWAKAEPEAKEMFIEVADAVKQTPIAQINRMNAMGANIKLRSDHASVNYRWDDVTIERAGLAEFHTFWMEHMDWEATAKAHGNVLIYHNEDGTTTTKPFEKEEFLKQWFHEIVSARGKEDLKESSIGEQVSKHRRIHIRRGAEVKALKKFSGHKHMGLLYIDQVRYRAEMSVVAREMGHKPMENLAAIKQRLGVPKAEEVKFKELKGLKIANLRNLNLDATARFLINELDNPVNKEVAGVFRKTRQASNVMFLGGSGIAALSDVPNIALVMEQMGVGSGGMANPKFLKAYVKANKRNFGSDAEMREWFNGQGAGMDAFLNATSRRFTIGDDSTGDLFSGANDMMFSLNYLNGITHAGQEAFWDVLTQNVARQLLEDGRLGDRFLANMESFGISKAEAESFSQALVETPDGVTRMDPNRIPDETVRRKFREYALQMMNDAVMVPDAGAQAALRFGTKDGTWLGGAVRSVMQYMSFPLGITRSLTNRFLVDHNGEWAWTSHQTSAIQALSYVASMMVMGWLSTAIKDISKYKAPILPGTASISDWKRIIRQSGVAGVLEPLLGAAQGSSRGLIAPLPLTVMSAIGDLGDGSINGAMKEVVSFSGSYPLIGPPLKWIISDGVLSGFGLLDD